MASRATQPYRATGARAQGATLGAMQRGRSAFMHSPGDIRRQAMKRKRKRKGRARYRSPLHKVLAGRRALSRY